MLYLSSAPLNITNYMFFVLFCFVFFNILYNGVNSDCFYNQGINLYQGREMSPNKFSETQYKFKNGMWIDKNQEGKKCC